MTSRRDIETRLRLTGEDQYERGMSKAGKSTKDFGKTADDIVDNLEIVGAAAAAALIPIGLFVKAFEVAGRQFAQLAQRGGPFNAVAEQFERLGNPELLRRLQDLSGYQVRQSAIMQSWSSAMDAGLVSASEYERWLVHITQISQARGSDPAALLERMRDVLSGGNLAGLAELGVNVGDVTKRLHEMGLSAETTEGKAAAFDIALQQLDGTQTQTAVSIDTLSDSWRASSNAANDYIDNVSRAITTNDALVAVFESLRESMAGVGVTAEGVGQGIALLAQSAIMAASQMVYAVAGIGSATITAINAIASNQGLRAILQFLGGLGTFNLALRPLSTAANMAEQTLQNMANIRPQLDAAAETARFIQQAVVAADMAGIAAYHATPGTHAPARPAGPTPPTPPAPGGQREQSAAMAAAEAAKELAAQRAAAEQESIQQGIDSWKEYQDQRLEAEREALAEGIRLQKDYQAEQVVLERQAAKEKASARFAEVQAELQANFDAVAGFSSTMGNIFGMIADNLEKQGKSAGAWRKAQGIALGIYYQIQAIGEVAKAVAAFMSQNYIEGAGHVAAAALHQTASVMSFVQLAQTGSRSSASKPSIAGAKFQAMPKVEDKSKGQGTTINNYLMGRSNADIGDKIAKAEWETERSGRKLRRYGISYA